MKYLQLSIWMLASLVFPKCNAQSVFINELMASNSNAYQDQVGEDEDWIELYNAGGTTVDLGGYYVSDDPGELKKFQLPSGTGDYVMPAGSYLILWASGKTHLARHLSFNLSGDGEEFFLSTPGEVIVDHLGFPKQRADISYGRKTNGGPEIVFFSPSSPNAGNVAANSFTGVSEPPAMSAASGFFQNPFTLTITSAVPGAEIYYTTDGSEPNKNNTVAPGTAYQFKNQYPQNPGQSAGPTLTRNFLTLKQNSPLNLSITDKSSQPDVYASISTTNDFTPTYAAVPVKPVYKGMVVRAKVYETGKLPSETISRSYWFTPNGQPKSNLPVFSIKTNPDNMFDYVKGIGVAGKDFVDWRNANPAAGSFGVPAGNYYRSDEIPVNVEMLVDGVPVMNQELGLRIHGAGSRTHDKKSFRLYSTGQNASQSNIDYPIFPSLNFHTFKRLLLRNSGNDYERMLLKDAYIHQIAKGLDMELQDYRPAVTYLNGEYWGIHDVRERLDEYYYASHYALEPDHIEFFADPDISGNSGHYGDLSNYIKTHNMADAGSYNYALERMDMDNFIDYCVLELYAANWDWPYGNVTYWRHKVPYNPAAGKGKDGRWRWSLFDVDLSFEELDANQFGKALGAPDFLLQYLLPNPTFRKKFINRYADLINSYFQPQRLLAEIESCKNAISGEIPENIKRWNRPASVDAWEANIQLMVNFATNRPNIARGHIQSQFGLNEGTRQITVNVSNAAHGFVRVNTIDILPTTPGLTGNPYPWKGTYFKDVSIALTAIPKPGFKFLQWENITNGDVLITPTIEFVPSSGSNYRAVFGTDVAPTKFPEPLDESACVYLLTSWAANAVAGTFPAHMGFVYMANDDPELSSEVVGFTSGAYDLTSRTRISGLGNEGISFINTGNAAGNPGYAGMKLGGAILALNTTGKTQVSVKWTGGTVTPNFRPYAIRLQYRLSETGPFTDVLNTSSQPVEYVRSATAGHSQMMPWVKLPAAALNQPYVQLLWRYYCIDPTISGARDELRLDDIAIQSCSDPLPVTLIRFDAKTVENQVAVTWVTSSELNNHHFEVERSADAKNWLLLKSVPGNGTSSQPKRYGIADELPLGGRSYYRLKQIDYDQTYMYSNLVSVNRPQPEAATLYPNPVKSVLRIILPQPCDASSYSITDIAGRKRKAGKISNCDALAIPVETLGSGLYMVQITMKTGTISRLKFLKE
ncbi:CotH kinase family protein [Dyadobacter sp. CY343]|uniref:CotH kinase family protein n=1 Tax=Dyadobacter sp. CY343 TaxID=2907299 RepID=UPI001F38A688|nr:CotH kinase family protein [Dyadobacter sp. CY343]MCE7060305.1 CotH kinase family protein [Dyadobacter sp. CY343]